MYWRRIATIFTDVVVVGAAVAVRVNAAGVIGCVLWQLFSFNITRERACYVSCRY